MADVDETNTTEPEEAQERRRKGTNSIKYRSPAPGGAPRAPGSQEKGDEEANDRRDPSEHPCSCPCSCHCSCACASCQGARETKGRRWCRQARKAPQPAEVAAPPPTPREAYSLEDHMTPMLRHTRQMQEARRTAVRDKYRNWVS